MMNIQLNNYSQ